jgi:ERCC4-type nuclease
MIIKIDNREHELIQNINYLIETINSFKELILKVENLPLGDIILNNGDEDKIIIERKSISDLSSSIKDGRYEEQSYRLNGLNFPNHNIIYLVEGDINKSVNRFKDSRIEKMTIYSAIFSLNYYKGFSVLRTFSLEETALFICNTANKIKKGDLEGKKSYYLNKSNILSDTPLLNNNLNNELVIENNSDNQDDLVELNSKDYVSVIKKIKKENITPENIGEIMLCQIPGISSVTAIAILSYFKTISNLIQTLEKENENCLKNVSYTNTKGQIKKLNKTCISNLVKFLLTK